VNISVPLSVSPEMGIAELFKGRNLMLIFWVHQAEGGWEPMAHIASGLCLELPSDIVHLTV
jgi:hypothetical protein